MARELSQEELLDFLCQAGGRVTNAALLGHFRGFLRDPGAAPDQLQRRRELFKGLVNSVAAVRQDPDGAKCVVLKRRYRDLVGEEGLRAPRAPQQPRRPRGRPPEGQEPPGVGASAPEIGAHGQRAGPRGAPEPPEEASRARGRRAAAGAPGGPRAGSPEPALRSRGSPPSEGQPGREPASAPGPPREGTPHPSAGASTKPPPPSAEALGAPGTALALASLAFHGDGSELLTLSDPHSCAAAQQQRTREWVANHSQPSPGSLAERPPQGPRRFWCVLPENFPDLPPNGGHPTLERLPPPRPASPPPLPTGPPIFRSIHSQLDLGDLENFVEEDSHESEESTSGPRDSPGELEEAPKVPLANGGQDELGTPMEYFLKFQQENTLHKSQGPTFRGNYSLPYIPAKVDGSVMSNRAAKDSSIPPWPNVPLKRSLRRSSKAERDTISSSDEDLLDEDLAKRNRRPPRARRSSRAEAVPSPKVDAPLTLKPIDPKISANNIWVPPGNVSSVLVSLRPVHRSSLVPLDSREHEWIVRLASGSWVQALTLFREDPQLALHKDFLTGYTALHWIAKHGALQALQELVKGAQKAGIVLDMNVKSSCGYTPLHLAAIHGHQGVIKLLVQRLQSRVNVRDSSGKKPWQYLTSNTTGEIWQLLGAPRGKPIFPVYSLVGSSSPTRKTKSHDVSRNIGRKTSLAALLKNQHNRWKMSHHHDRFRTLEERDEFSD
ncbi:ankyrin repeat domain-containing protein SOWAHB [Macrotis lagotis]|uniref:ankyrin repeat domain-containing protein SOWAHB n=1 Tax=Macrotis lagotis TaxID=92651 RepID=UPI003D68F550